MENSVGQPLFFTIHAHTTRHSHDTGTFDEAKHFTEKIVDLVDARVGVDKYKDFTAGCGSAGVPAFRDILAFLCLHNCIAQPPGYLHCGICASSVADDDFYAELLLEFRGELRKRALDEFLFLKRGDDDAEEGELRVAECALRMYGFKTRDVYLFPVSSEEKESHRGWSAGLSSAW